MAEQTDKEVCSICLNDFQQPVIIDCQHSFCFCCLEDYVNKTSTKDQFQCPLCRCLINVGDWGVQQYRPDNVINIPQCDVCSEDICQYFCRDCDQYLCKSCKTMRDKMIICKGHVVCRYDQNQNGQQSRSKEKTPATTVTHHKDFCIHHDRKKVTIFCEDCSLAMCWKCFVANHNGHNYLNLQDDEVRQNMRKDLRTLNGELQTQITSFQKHYDNLNSKLIEVKHFTKTECAKIDAQVDKICLEFRKIGENIKTEMQKTSEKEESKFRKSMEEIKRLTEDVKASVKYSANVLEDSSIVQVLQRLPKVRQEKDESSCRQLGVPDARYSTFQVAEIDKTLLINQIGKIVSCLPYMFEDIFNVKDMPVLGQGVDRGKQHVVSGFTWRIAVYNNSVSLRLILSLDDLEDKSMRLCNVDVTFKAIKKTSDRQVVVKQCNGKVNISLCSACKFDLIVWEEFGNSLSGFTNDEGSFTIQVTINEVTSIDRS